jgi:preprotein translocase subunit SecG
MLLAILVCFQLVLAIALICMIFIQKTNSGMGALGGSSSSSNTVFGASGAFSFLFKLTAVLSILFFINSISLTRLISHEKQKSEQSVSGANQLPSGLSKKKK